MARFLAEAKETKQGLDHSGVSSDKEKSMESKGASHLLPANIAVVVISVVTVNLCVKTAQVPVALPSTPAPMLSVARAITHGNPNRPEVALTFDDGPSEYTPQVLAILQHYEVRATFFSIGQNITQFPTYQQQDLTRRNTVENHTFTHPHLTNALISEHLPGIKRDTKRCAERDGDSSHGVPSTLRRI